MNPGLAEMLETEKMPDKERIRKYHDDIYAGYRSTLYGERNVLFKMKEIWVYLIHIFADSKKYGKKIKKAENLRIYEKAVDELFEERELTTEYTFG